MEPIRAMLTVVLAAAALAAAAGEAPPVTEEQKQEATKLVREHLTPVAAVEPAPEAKAHIAQLIQNFASAEAELRDRAAAELAGFGPAALGQLRAARGDKKPEVVAGATRIAAGIEGDAKAKTLLGLRKLGKAGQAAAGEEKARQLRAVEETARAVGRLEAAGGADELERARAAWAEARRLAADIAALEKELARPETARKTVRAKVVDVRAATGHIALDAGTDSGVRESTVFTIRRGAAIIGRAKVTTVWKDFSGGEVIEGRGDVKPGDDAEAEVEVPTADVRTTVGAVDQAAGTVVLDAGEDSGVRPGMIFLVHRADTYIGKVRVQQVTPKACVALITEVKQPIKAGDQALSLIRDRGVAGQPPPPAAGEIRTKVVDVRKDKGTVALGAGKDAGVREGQVFTIRRGAEAVGKVKVTAVWNDFSSGEIIEGQDAVKPGDDAVGGGEQPAGG